MFRLASKILAAISADELRERVGTKKKSLHENSNIKVTVKKGKLVLRNANP